MQSDCSELSHYSASCFCSEFYYIAFYAYCNHLRHSCKPAGSSESVRNHRHERDRSCLYCLGDVVGYGANPNECIAMIRDRGVSCIIGNHDKAAINVITAVTLNRFAQEAIEWTARQLTPEHIEFLSHLPYIIVDHDCTFVHASPGKPEQWDYVFTAYDAQENFQFFMTPICWIGHTHRSGVYCEDLKSTEVKRGSGILSMLAASVSLATATTV